MTHHLLLRHLLATLTLGCAAMMMPACAIDECDAPHRACLEDNTLYECGWDGGTFTEEHLGEWETPCDKESGGATCVEANGDAACVLASRESCDPTSNEKRCAADARTLEYCSSVGFWAQLLTCDAGEQCDLNAADASCSAP